MITGDKTVMVSSIVRDFISGGLVPDDDTLHFIKSAYGLYTDMEISEFLESGEGIDAVADLVSCPSDSLRESVEAVIPGGGLSREEIKTIEETASSDGFRACIFFSGSRYFLSPGDSKMCTGNIIRRLNLDINLSFADELHPPDKGLSVLGLKTLLRKKKFIPGEETSFFISDLVSNYSETDLPGQGGLAGLIEACIELLDTPGEKPYDILSRKKYFYENAVSEQEEFARLLKTYSMEFIMLKRIQPPLITADEARSKIAIINRLTSIVWGMIIPSVNNVIMNI